MSPKTHIRTHFKRHLTRKNICKPIIRTFPLKSIADSYGIDIPSTENIGVTQMYTEGYPDKLESNEPNQLSTNG